MKHIKIFEDFAINEYTEIRGTKGLKVKGLSLWSAEDFSKHYVIVDYKKPFFGKAILSNGRHKFDFIKQGRIKDGIHGIWKDENGIEVTDDNLLSDLTYFLNLQNDNELASLTS